VSRQLISLMNDRRLEEHPAYSSRGILPNRPPLPSLGRFWRSGPGPPVPRDRLTPPRDPERDGAAAGVDVPPTKAAGKTGDYAERGLQILGFSRRPRLPLGAEHRRVWQPYMSDLPQQWLRRDFSVNRWDLTREVLKAVK
jgi:hypothetical protein